MMQEHSLSAEAVAVPRFLYGTAWKEDATVRLTELALRQGFRGIDTANQRRHYHEAAVGQALANAQRGGLRRDELFVQTKFTFQAGQDHRLPYDAKAPIAEQVRQSFSSSLEHLGLDRLDSYLLHGPSRRVGLGAADWEAWRSMEALHAAGQTRFLGISNVSLEQLAALFGPAKVKPTFVQNRCYASEGWDRNVRSFCRENSIVYQGFSLLTANRAVLAHPALLRMAARHGKTVCQLVFRFALEVGMLPLTGTSDVAHMREDLEAFTFRLEPEETQQIESLVG